jgi:phosphoribosylformylglycinamidine synthase
MPKVFVNVQLKSEILDPQGNAIHAALRRLGISTVSSVRQGKQFVFTLDETLTEEQLAEIKKVAGTLLSNPVIEVYSIEVKNES